MTDRVTRAYLDAAAAPGSRLGRAVEQAERLPSLAAWDGAYLDRPLFLPEAGLRAFAEDLSRVVELLLALPGRLFGGDLGRFAAAVGVEGERSALMRRLGTPPPAGGRADVYHDGTAYRLLEIGIGSELGGWDRSGEVPRAFLRDEAFAAFAAERRLGYTHSPTLLADALRQAAGGEPVVALVEGPGALAEWAGTWSPLREALRGAGLRCHLGELGDLTVRGGRAYLAGDRIDVLFRCFDTDQLLGDADATAQAERLFRLHESGGLLLWTPLESNLFCEKGGLALLSAGDACSAAERALIDRVLPWTRLLTRDSPDDLIDECRARRDRLILKPGGLYGGYGVVPGWERTDAEWREALREAAATGGVVQERIAPRAEPVARPGAAEEPWHAVYGFYYTPAGYAGVHARVAPAGHSSVISLTTNKHVRSAGVFHVGEPS